MFVFLTKDRADASDENWVPYSYQDIHRVLGRCVRANQGAVGGDVRAFIDHYLRLLIRPLFI